MTLKSSIIDLPAQRIELRHETQIDGKAIQVLVIG